MTLLQRDINTAVLTAALFVKDRQKEELITFAHEMSNREGQKEAIRTLCEMFANARGEKVEDVNAELAEEIIRRILANIKLRFGESVLSPEPPPSEEIDALCET